jgi:hypothetical protein
MWKKALLVLSLLFTFPNYVRSVVIGAHEDQPFIQEYHQPYSLDSLQNAKDVRALLVDRQGLVWAATAVGVYILNPETAQSVPAPGDGKSGPTYALAMTAEGNIWVGAWDGLYCSSPGGLFKISDIQEPISALLVQGEAVQAFGPGGRWLVSNKGAQKLDMPFPRSVRAVKADKKDGFFVATERGLFHQQGHGITAFQKNDELLGATVADVEFDQDGTLWIGGLGGITLQRNGKRIGQYTPDDGLPFISIQTLACASDGAMWIGTRQGVVRCKEAKWTVRNSRRWLMNDDVRDIVFDQKGRAWIATAAGVSAIVPRMMTLAQKAAHFQRITEARHVRAPYLVEKCQLNSPGDTLNWEPRDDDNDGQYTSMYLAMESFRYAASKNPQARENALRAFSALRFLQTVTETDGFVARTVIPSSWTRMADANHHYSSQEWAETLVANPREKRVENMWRRSRDSKWLWKGDTSSDEITGHMFGYLSYFDLVADDAEKKTVRDHVCRIVDYIIANGLTLKDIDGTHTQWGVWSPEKLNLDPDWATERGINSVEILSYLKLAFHVSGDQRYEQIYRDLLQKHNYLENVRQPRSTNPAWITHIDDELLALAFPCLLLHEKDPQLLKVYRTSLETWYRTAEGDKSPFFNFTYAGLSGLDPRLEPSIFFLQDTPLDLIRWRIDHSQRLDVGLRFYPEFENMQTDRLLPPSEIAFFRWDTNPWYSAEGDGGRTESDGVFWLLPYWMGRYYGFIR